MDVNPWLRLFIEVWLERAYNPKMVWKWRKILKNIDMCLFVSCIHNNTGKNARNFCKTHRINWHTSTGHSVCSPDQMPYCNQKGFRINIVKMHAILGSTLLYRLKSLIKCINFFSDSSRLLILHDLTKTHTQKKNKEKSVHFIW